MKRFLGVLVAAMFVMAIAGCSDSDNGTDTLGTKDAVQTDQTQNTEC